MWLRSLGLLRSEEHTSELQSLISITPLKSLCLGVMARLGLSSPPPVWVCVVEISGFAGLTGYGFVEVVALVVHRGSRWLCAF